MAPVADIRHYLDALWEILNLYNAR